MENLERIRTLSLEVNNGPKNVIINQVEKGPNGERWVNIVTPVSL